ncbi:alpha/beta hydrolase family protein [Bacillus solimangrovi]|uniref:Peptidase S9 prolyl oligopeptidase catalytic domain-containing protein n=1 Tax=Bacillus solimangrovi TaxID=1305675 RepID=A0A1E5LKD9_9BACI|nr:prolyl oligopeptidase family serine peptidase [Bacillus solimangrovi]OEH94559.1 hypothetical protein BFG57_07785 [Bacillus solimangrovi]
MKKVLILISVVFILMPLYACSNSDQQLIISKEEVQLSFYEKETEAYKITYTSDGLGVNGYLVKPRKIEGKAPVLIFNRGGNREFGAINEQALQYLSFWADKGFVVLVSQYRGNAGGEGQEQFGGEDVNDVLKLVDVARELPYVDTDNIVMLGASRGGMMTYLAIKHGIDIKAAVIVSGMSDLFHTYENREQGMKDTLQQLVGDPEADRDEYEKRSAVFWTDEIDVPVLILHGDADWRVPIEQAEELVESMQETKNAHKFVVYPNGDHGLKNYFDEYTDEALKWFNHHLQIK